jgi:hypothetical protein
MERGVMGPLLVAFIIGVASAATFEVGRRALEWHEHRQGELAGWWYQITWNPDKPDQIWSIEWVQVQHRRHQVTGTMWRVYTERDGQAIATKENFCKVWKFAADYSGGHVLNGHYSCKTGDGWDGVFQMLTYTRTSLIGNFRAIVPDPDVTSASDPRGLVPLLKPFAPVVEWVRCDCERENAILPRLHAQDLHVMCEHLPARCGKAFRARFDPTLRFPMPQLRSLAYGNAATDRLGASALEHELQERQKSADAALSRPDAPPLTPPFREEP